MVFQPVIPTTGIVGWNFLQSTYDRQLEAFSESAQVSSDTAFLQERLSSPISVEEFLDDPRLRRTTLTAFGLAGEEWKRGFISKVFEEAADPESTFLQRLNNPAYTAFAETFEVVDGQISLSPATVQTIASDYREQSFRVAVGEVDPDQRLNLTYQAEIGNLVREGSTSESNIFRILGNIPVRTVLEQALGLPTEVQQLELEKQAEIFQERLQSAFRIDDVQELTSDENIERVIQRFSTIAAINNGPSPTTRGATAVTLLSGIGSTGSQNLFLSGF